MSEEGDEKPYVTVEQLREAEAACSHEYLLVISKTRRVRPEAAAGTTAYLVCRFCLRQAKVRITR